MNPVKKLEEQIANAETQPKKMKLKQDEQPGIMENQLRKRYSI